MQTLTPPDTVLGGARALRDTGLWLGRWAKRSIVGPLTGVCTVCNNLQPGGHEDTLGLTPHSLGRYIRHEGQTQRIGIIKEAALVLTGIKTKELLRCRDIDPSTGKPFRDCRYCRLLCDIFDAFFVDEYMNWVTDTRNGMYLEVGLMIREGAPLIVNCIGCFTWDKYVMHPRVDVEIFGDTAEALTVPGVPTMGLTLPRVMNTRDPSCLQFAKGSLGECQQTHPACAKIPTDFVPTRMLHIGADDGDIRLCENLPTPSSWVALSHCWGGSKPLKLFKINIADLKQNIKLADLPPTFQNAIEVCRGLSMPYLWIDSLCIIQDDTDDWNREAARMGRVYNDAFLVLIASSSAKPEEPFLGPRDEDWSEKHFEFQTHNGTVVPLKARKRHLLAAPLDQGPYEPPFSGAWATNKRVGPLYSRGWCFQESYLATRALHYTPGSLVFECKTQRRSQDTPPPFPQLLPGTLGEVSEERKWRMLVKSYTSRQLTYGSDKLHAVAGIAQSMPQAGRSRYLAGLWSESLLGDLVWQVMATADRSTTVMTFGPDDQAAPSWSWASINQGVLWNEYRKFEPLATVLEAETALVVGSNRFGGVSGGHVKLRGRLKTCRVTHDQNKKQHHAYYLRPDGTKSREQWFLGDGCIVPVVGENGGGAVARRASPRKEYYAGMRDFDAGAAFFCIARTGRLSYNHIGLIIAPSESRPDCMERVGVITNMSSEWYDGGEEAVITLV